MNPKSPPLSRRPGTTRKFLIAQALFAFLPALIPRLAHGADQVPWNGVYEAGQLPQNSEPDWRVDIVSGSQEWDASIVEHDGESVLEQTLGIDRGGWRIAWQNAGSSSDSMTVEMRARIVSGEGFLLGLEVRNDEIGGVGVRISETAIEMIAGSTRRKLVAYPIGQDFHVYRLTLDGNVSRLYVDGDSTPVAEIEGTAGLGSHLQFGDFGPVNGEGTVEYSSVRWTADGAFAP